MPRLLYSPPAVRPLYAPKRIPLTHGLTQKAWQELRLIVLARYHRRCLFFPTGCVNGMGSDGMGKGLIVDHIQPYSVSHDNSLANLRVLCVYHNARIGYRKNVNPLLLLMMQTDEGFSELNQVEHDLNKGFQVLRHG